MATPAKRVKGSWQNKQPRRRRFASLPDSILDTLISAFLIFWCFFYLFVSLVFWFLVFVLKVRMSLAECMARVENMVLEKSYLSFRLEKAGSISTVSRGNASPSIPIFFLWTVSPKGDFHENKNRFPIALRKHSTQPHRERYDKGNWMGAEKGQRLEAR